MARNENSSDSVSVTVTLSKQSASLLEQIAEDGVYGRSRAEVASRFIDQVLREYIDPPRFKMLPGRKGNVRAPVRVDSTEGNSAREGVSKKKTARK